MSRIGLPAIYQWPETSDLGGLIGYGPPFAQMYRQRARQVVKMLRGTAPGQPSNLPTSTQDGQAVWNFGRW